MPTAPPTPPTDRGCAAVGTHEDPRRRMGSGAGGKGPASPRASAFATPAPHQGCAAPAAGLRPPLTRRRRRQDHRLPTQNGGTHDLTTADKRTLATYATPAPVRRSRSPKRVVTMPKSPVTLRRDARSRSTEMSGHVRRNTHRKRTRQTDSSDAPGNPTADQFEEDAGFGLVFSFLMWANSSRTSRSNRSRREIAASRASSLRAT